MWYRSRELLQFQIYFEGKGDRTCYGLDVVCDIKKVSRINPRFLA